MPSLGASAFPLTSSAGRETLLIRWMVVRISLVHYRLKSSKQLNALKLFLLITSKIFQLTHRYRYQFVREVMADM